MGAEYDASYVHVVRLLSVMVDWIGKTLLRFSLRCSSEYVLHQFFESAVFPLAKPWIVEVEENRTSE